MKTCSSTNFPGHRTIYFPQLLKRNLLSETIVSQAQPAFTCLNSAVITVEGHSMVGHPMGVKSKILNSFKFPPLIQLIEKK